jgi:hypothetical protein
MCWIDRRGAPRIRQSSSEAGKIGAHLNAKGLERGLWALLVFDSGAGVRAAQILRDGLVVDSAQMSNALFLQANAFFLCCAYY